MAPPKIFPNKNIPPASVKKMRELFQKIESMPDVGIPTFSGNDSLAETAQHLEFFRWAKIKSARSLDGYYDWTEVYSNDGLQWFEFPGSPRGTKTVNPLKEANNNRIPYGKIVPFIMGQFEPSYGYLFIGYYPNGSNDSSHSPPEDGSSIDDGNFHESTETDGGTDDDGNNYYDTVTITIVEDTDLTGLEKPDPEDSIVVEIINDPDSTGDLVIKPDDPGSSPGNLITTPTGTDLIVPPGGYVIIEYDPEDDKWKIVDDGNGTYPGPYIVIIDDDTNNLDTGINEIIIVDVVDDDHFLTGLITGFQPGKEFTIIVDPFSDYSLTITDTDPNSDPGNQFIIPSTPDTPGRGGSLILGPGKKIDIVVISNPLTGEQYYLIGGGTGYGDYLVTDYPKYFRSDFSDTVVVSDELSTDHIGSGGGTIHTSMLEEIIEISEAVQMADTVNIFTLNLTDDILISDDYISETINTATPPP